LTADNPPTVENIAVSIDNAVVSVDNLAVSVENASISVENVSVSVENASVSVENIPVTVDDLPVPVDDVAGSVDDVTDPCGNAESISTTQGFPLKKIQFLSIMLWSRSTTFRFLYGAFPLLSESVDPKARFEFHSHK
jgi:hypothetical protein